MDHPDTIMAIGKKMASIVGNVSIEVTPRSTMVFTRHVPAAVEAAVANAPNAAVGRQILDACHRLREAERSILVTLANHPDEAQLIEEFGLDGVDLQVVATLAGEELDRRKEKLGTVKWMVGVLVTVIVGFGGGLAVYFS